MVTFLIAAALAVLFGLAIRHLIKHGTCDCSSKGGCNGRLRRLLALLPWCGTIPEAQSKLTIAHTPV